MVKNNDTMDGDWKAILSAAADLDWPRRKSDSTLFQELKSQGWLVKPLLTILDDWNLKSNDWDSHSKMQFSSDNKSVKKTALLMALGVIAARSSGMISQKDRGISYFIYRKSRRKSIFYFHKINKQSDASVVIAEDGQTIIFNVPQLLTPLFKGITPPHKDRG